MLSCSLDIQKRVPDALAVRKIKGRPMRVLSHLSFHHSDSLSLLLNAALWLPKEAGGIALLLPLRKTDSIAWRETTASGYKRAEILNFATEHLE